MPSLERKNYWITFVSLIVSVVSMALAYQSIQVSKELAEASGSLDSSIMSVGLGGHPLSSKGENYVMVGASVVSTTDIPVVGAIPFTFKSIGKKSLESVLISFQYHELFRRNLLELAESKVSGAFASSEFKKSTSAEEKRYFVSYSIQTLNPGIALKIAEPFFLEETHIQDKIPVTLKDGNVITIPYEASFTKNFGIVVSARIARLLAIPFLFRCKKQAQFKI